MKKTEKLNMLAVADNAKVYVVAEIGQNHQGNVEIAKKLISCAKDCGVDCVKFQKSHLPEKFNFLALNRPYLSPHSWGETYGKHKEFLELSENDFCDLKKYADDLEIDFTASAMDKNSLQFLHKMGVPFIKIGSGDTGNSKLLKAAAQLNKYLVVSTGMCDMKTVKKVYDILSSRNCQFAIMHCVSSYPAPDDQLNLRVITTYKREFPNIPIGYSGHELGIDCTLAAVQLGATIVERHFTLDKNSKGSDHACSLTPAEMKKLVFAIRQSEINPQPIDPIKFRVALGNGIKQIQISEKACIDKLGKTLVATNNLYKGHVLTEDDIEAKVAEPKGINCLHLDDIVGHVLLDDILMDHSIHWHHISNST